MEEPRAHHLLIAQLARQARRFDDMVEAITSIAKLGVELTAEELKLLCVGYKNVLEEKKIAWRILSVATSKEEARGNTQYVSLIKESLKRVEDELTVKCKEILFTIIHYLLPSSKTREASVFYYKLKGDYYSQLAEFISEGDRQEAISESQKAYKAATAIAELDLPPTNPIRLAVALNFSIFLYETMTDGKRACGIAKKALEDAAALVNNLDERSYEESTLIMRLIKDNLTLWTYNPEDEDTVEEINSIAKLGVELTAEQRNLLSVGYKNLLGAQRASWRILSVIKSKEEAGGSTRYVALVNETLKRVEDELTAKCNEILLTIDDYLLPSSKTGEAAVFYHKMKGDYYSYLAEFKSEADWQEATSQSQKAYEAATSIAKSELHPTDPTRVALALNFSVFLYHIMADTKRIMRLIGDNLTLWISDTAEDEGEEGQVSNFFDSLVCDTLYDILGRLALRDVLRLGGVSKYLSKVVVDYVQALLREKVFLPSFPFHSVSLNDEYSMVSHEIQRESDIPIDPNTFPYQSFPENVIVGSINGTLLVLELFLSPQTLVLYNPITNHQKQIPPRPPRPHPLGFIEDDSNLNNYSYGLGWIEKSSEIIVVQLSKLFDEAIEPCCEMYSLKQRCWKRLVPLKGGVDIRQYGGTFHKERKSLYWIARNRETKGPVILKLEMEKLEFSTLEFSTDVKEVPIDCLGIVRGMLCALTRVTGSPRCEVRVLEQTGKWSILQTIQDHQLYDSKITCFPKILTFTNDGMLFLVNEEKNDKRRGSFPKKFLSLYKIFEATLQQVMSPKSLLYISSQQAAVYTESTCIPEYIWKVNTTGQGESGAEKVDDTQKEIKRACALSAAEDAVDEGTRDNAADEVGEDKAPQGSQD
ncbi:14-3-3-like protein [Artemisia annua]|uniref:14-3-3-like protein n=1 Tax=Artemisia annua TaxID=35608 RepID=A0A2U1Q0Z8_ARTAN|nr:14-3-3-like protein [Artemisia annua]